MCRNKAVSSIISVSSGVVETKVVEAPATTENLGTTQSTTNVSEQATTSAASSEVVSETASTTANESQTPTESVAGQTREAVTTDRAASETASVPNETNVTGGQYYRDEYGYWHYKDASGKNLTGPQTIDGVKVYFTPGGVQVKGNFGWDGHYYDKDSGALVTNKFVEEYGRTYYVDENGNKAIGSKEINGAWNYFDKHGELITNNFAPDGRYYDKYGEQVDFGRNRYFELNGEWYYAGNDGAILKGPQTIDGVKVYFHQNGIQAKGYFVKDEEDNKSRYYDKDTGALATNQYVIAYNPSNHQNERYYVNDEGIRLTGPQTIDGKHAYLAGMEKVETVEDIKEACVKINKLGAKNVIIKSGSRVDGDYMVDVLFDGKEFTIQKKAKMKNIYNSGAGCTFSAAITAGLAKGLDIHQAFENAQNFIDKAVANSFKLNEFTGALAHWQTR